MVERKDLEKHSANHCRVRRAGLLLGGCCQFRGDGAPRYQKGLRLRCSLSYLSIWARETGKFRGDPVTEFSLYQHNN